MTWNFGPINRVSSPSIVTWGKNFLALASAAPGNPLRMQPGVSFYEQLECYIFFSRGGGMYGIQADREIGR